MNPSTAETWSSAARKLARSWASGSRSRQAIGPTHTARRATLAAGHPLIGGEEVRVIAGIEPRLGRLVPGKAR